MTASRALPLVQLPVLLVLGTLLRWGAAGWTAAVLATALLDAAVLHLLRRTGTSTLGPADPITLGRATLTCGVLALAVEHLLGAPARPLTLAGVASVSLVLDLLDGWVARRSRSESAFGGRLDGEADAFLMLVLSAWVAPDVGWWVLPIGLARYGFWLAGAVLPWMAARLPFRAWRKVATAVAGIALAVAAARVLPSPLVEIGLAVAFGLIAESFGRDILWLWRRRAHPLRRAREIAYGRSEFVDQMGFTPASEIREVADRAGIGPGTRVLDLCCGRGGPGRLLVEECRCEYTGVDEDPGAVAHAGARVGTGARVLVGRVPPLPAGPFDVVLLLEAMLAFRDKAALLRAVGAALLPGGRFAFTVEVGAPLTADEQARMPAGETVWPVPWEDLLAMLRAAGFEVAWQVERSRAHQALVERLVAEIAADEAAIAAQIGRPALDDLLTSHRLWARWLADGRVRKCAVVARRRA